MDDFQKRVIEKLDKIDDRMNSVDKTLAEQHVSLKDHMRRTELLELALDPIKVKISMFEGVLKFVGILSIVIGIAVGIAKLFGG